MAVLLYLVLALIGIGPTLYLNRAKLRDAGTWLIAPVVGFLLMVILATVLVQLQLPIERWATPLTVVLCLLSLGLAGTWWYQRRGAREPELRDFDSPASGSEAAWWGGLAILIGGLLAVLPVQIGGWWFNHARGNAWDASSYAQIAGALAHEPINWLLHSDLATLTSKNNIYAHITELLNSPWGARRTTCAVFGWAAELTRTHVFDLEPQFYVLHLLLVIGPAYLLARRLGAGPRWSCVAAVLVGSGFWAGFLLDLGSMGQLDSLPLVLLLLALWPQTPGSSWNPLRKGRLLLGLIFCALTLTYAELIPITMLGLLIGAGILCVRDHQPIRGVAQQLLPLGLGILLALAMVPNLAPFLLDQFSFAAGTQTNSWISTQHLWLVNAPHTGFWGLSLLDAGLAGWWTTPLAFLMVLLASAMTVILLWQLLTAFVRPGMNATNRMVAGMVCAGLAQAAILLCIGHLLGAVKGSGYIASLCLLAVIAWWAAAAKEGTWPKPPLRWILSSAILLFCLCQAWSAVQRTVLVLAGSDYLSYVNHIPEYRARDFDILPIRNILGHNPKLNVGIDMKDPWLAQSARIGLAWDVHLVEPLGATDVVTGKVTPMPVPAGPIDYWIFDSEALPASVQANEIVARTSDIILAENCCFLIDLSNSNGVNHDPVTGLLTFWLGGPPTVVRVSAPGAGYVTITSRFTAGPTLPSASTHYLTITTNADSMPNDQSVASEMTQIRFPVTAGVNTVGIACGEVPDMTHQTGGDVRPLMWQVSDPRVHFSANIPAPPRGGN